LQKALKPNAPVAGNITSRDVAESSALRSVSLAPPVSPAREQAGVARGVTQEPPTERQSIDAVAPFHRDQLMTDPVYYLHIPKTGGTFFTSFLDSQFYAQDICPAQLLPELFRLAETDLPRYRFFRGHLWHGLDSHLKRRLQYITLLRNPVQRTISWYSHVRRNEAAYRHQRVVDENWSLLDFVRDEETNWDMVNAQALFLAVDLDYAALARDPVGYGQAVVKQYARRGNDRALLDLAKRRLERCAFFGITERMQDSVSLLSYTMGFYPDFSLPRLNVAGNRPAESEISAETIDAIKAITGIDQELYDWAGQLFEERFRLMVKSLLASNYKSCAINKNLPWHGPVPVEERKRFSVAIADAPSRVPASGKFEVKVIVANQSDCGLSARNANPVNLSYHWIDVSDGSVVVFDGERTALSPGLPAGEKGQFQAMVLAPERAARYVLRITLVQEGVAWFDDASSSVFEDRKMVVL
jgi:hypothetical protein